MFQLIIMLFSSVSWDSCPFMIIDLSSKDLTLEFLQSHQDHLPKSSSYIFFLLEIESNLTALAAFELFRQQFFEKVISR